jgi:hypothetical protein
LPTDDASTADARTCQIETWHEHAGADRSFVFAPACAVAPGVEIDVQSSWPTPHDVVHQEAGLALKIVPAGWKLETPAGDLNFGLKLSGDWLKPALGSWQGTNTTLLGISTLKLSDSLAVHVNVGLARDRASSTRGILLNGALAWSPQEHLLVFAEAQGNNKKDIFGGTVGTLGARWWLVKDTLGLDFTASRESGGSNPKRYTIGLGWYGIGS